MTKILIDTNMDKVIKEQEEVTTLMDNSGTLNDYLKKNLKRVLTKEILLDVLDNSGENLISDFRADQESKLTKAGIVGITKENIMATVDEKLKEDLLLIRGAFFQKGSISLSPKTGLLHLIFNENGDPEPAEGFAEAIVEKHSIYASTKEHFELHKAQADAAAAINKLIGVTKKYLPATVFVNAQSMYGTFFEFNAAIDKVYAKPLNYKIF